ncbi:MAG: trypsin-like peptidase domain-containing protein [Planctomycetaceae bacterium]
MGSKPRIFSAGLRESGVPCPHCSNEIQLSEQVAVCADCGTAHHESCWSTAGCGAYDCTPANREGLLSSASVLRISFDELQQTPPAVSTRPIIINNPIAITDDYQPPRRGPTRRSKLAIAAFIVGVFSIPAFGIATGPLAMILGVAALLSLKPFQTGVVYAAASIVLGLGSFVGWTLFLFQGVPLVGGSGNQANVSLEEIEVDPQDLQGVSPEIERAMRSNVLIEVDAGWNGLMGQSIGSGVILKIVDQTAIIVTNRHVIDAQFAEAGGTGLDSAPLPNTSLRVKMIGEPPVTGKVLWIAPYGIDLALVQVAINSRKIDSAIWEDRAPVVIGSKVFAIGNPHGLGWSHTAGDVSQIRRQRQGPMEIKVVQTSAAINPGNSGGGLYDAQGHLIGINTWTQDKHVADGLSFAIDFQTLLDLAPATYQLPKSQSANP